MAHPMRMIIVFMSFYVVCSCGPDTIFLRPALDTPAQHVKNGHSLLARGKIDAAHAEFTRARSLAASYAPAYVGLALVQGYRGDLDSGFETMNQARGLATSPTENEAVDEGYKSLERLRKASQD